jgi:hypothetical protein
MLFKELKNSFVAAQINGDRYFRATGSTCDCETAFGSNSGQYQDDEAGHTHSSDIEKHRKKGWSQHKIERGLAEKSGSIDRHQRQERFDEDLLAMDEGVFYMFSKA